MSRNKKEHKSKAKDALDRLRQEGFAEDEALVFVDLDGTLVDFEKGVSLLGAKMKDTNKMWDAISEAPRFWRTLPWLHDGYELWANLQKFKPVILTGLPSGEQQGGASLRKRAEDQKRAWCRDHLGPDVLVLCVDAREKHTLSGPRRILVDDSERLREAWERSGGDFVLRRGISETLALVEAAVSKRNVDETPCATVDHHMQSPKDEEDDECCAIQSHGIEKELTVRRPHAVHSATARVEEVGLHATFCKLEISEAETSQRAILTSAIHSMVEATFEGKFEIYLVGSSGAGLADATSDLDFALVPSGALMEEPRSAEISEGGEQKLLEQLARACENECGLKVEIVLTRSKAPDLVKCVDPRSGLQCDIVLRNGGNGAMASVDKAMLLRFFVQASIFFRPLVRVVKLWAKTRQLIDPVNGKLNSFTWTLMTAFFLQTIGLLPVPDCSADAMRRLRLGARVDARLHITNAQDVPVADLMALLQGFFAYWLQFDYCTSCVSVQQGCCISVPPDMPIKSSKKARSTQDSRRSFLVEDPVETHENTARTLSDKNLEEVRAEFNRALVMLQQGQPWDKICHVPTIKKIERTEGISFAREDSSHVQQLLCSCCIDDVGARHQVFCLQVCG
mmetsp:Transcript_69276/g.109418  ORF Transcript_69276/g.109418 Transcript_69276/m.109418 type:complete len:623 (+) Transcript_69276:82-1950(+)